MKKAKTDPCLHCAIIAAINAWQKDHGDVCATVVLDALIQVGNETLRVADGEPQYPDSPQSQPGPALH